MPCPSQPTLKPRKTPRQARSAATVETIFTATIQVLSASGSARLTTTRVAERAGVSVGTLYQYFPHKQALLCALIERQLEAVAQAMEHAATCLGGQLLVAISDGLVSAWMDAKTRDVAASRALYGAAADFAINDLMVPGSKRIRTAIQQALAGATDLSLKDPEAVSFALAAVLGGSVRSVIERGGSDNALATLRAELSVLCRAYLSASAEPSPKIGLIDGQPYT